LFEALFKYPRADFARGELIYAGSWPTLLVSALALAAIVLVVLFLYRRRRQASWPQLTAVGALQLAMVALLLWVLMQPTLTTERLREGENAIALVVDNSASMAYGVDESRLAVALRNLAAGSDASGQSDVAVRHYELGSSAVSVPSFTETVPVAGGTDLHAGLVSILEEARFSPLAAVILSSDGADTDGGMDADEIAELAAYGVPVHTIGVGRERIPEDLELQDVTVPDKALPGSTVPARVVVRHDAPAETRLKVYDGDDLLQIVPLELTGDAGVTTAWVEIELAMAGPHQLSFSVDPRDDETELRNNSRSTLVNVAAERYRILYFEGEPRWEYKFMRRAVTDDEDLAIATLLRVSPNKYYRQGIDSPEQLEDGFPATANELFAYDALIIGSVEAASLSPEQQQIIFDFVSERGGSLLMLAGPNGLGNGGWGQSALADVLPVLLPPTSTDSFHRRKVPVRLTPQGLSSQMLRFAADNEANREAWLELPEVADYQVVGNVKPAAVSLLNVDTEDGLLPLLVMQPFGRGHAYVLATGGTWRWQMSMPLEDQKHEVFWRQLLRAMVASAPEDVSLTAISGAGDSKIQLRAEFRDQAFAPMDDVGVSMVASHDDGETLTVPMQPDQHEAGVFVGELAPPRSGTWYFEAVAQREGEPVAVARTSVLHESGQAEFFGFRRDSGTLRRLSKATGGRYFEAGELDGLDDALRYSSSGITETEYRPLWDAPAVFVLLLLLKSGEWLLRRRWSTI
jgi:uncharacterized membrane protein